MAEQTLGQFALKLERIEKALVSPAMLNRVGKAGADDATGAIKSRIGDTSLSHWTRKKPIDLTLKSKVISDHEIEVAPDRRAVGPSRVLNDGRQSYAKGDRRLTGKVSKKTGQPLKRRAYKRAVGGHGGKHTWDDGVRLIQKNTPRRVAEETSKVLAKEFRRG